MGKSALFLSTAVALAATFGMSGFAVAAGHNTTVTTRPHLAPPAAGEHKIKGTILNSGYYGASGSGFTDLGQTQSVTCKKTCTLAISAMAQLCSFGSGSNPDVAISVLVDGNSVDGGPFAGQATANICNIINWQGVYAAAIGTHSVDFQVYDSSLTFVAQNSERTDVTSP